MPDKKDHQLTSVLSSGGLFAAGVLLGNVLQFIAGIIIVRMLTLEQYGDFALANSSIAMLSVFCLAGVPPTMVRFVSQGMRKNQDKAGEANTIIGSSAIIVLFLSVLCASVLFMMSGVYAEKVDSEHLESILKVLVLTLPVSNMMTLLSAYFRSRNNTLPKVLFEDVFYNLVRVLLLLVALLYAFSLSDILYLYLVASIVSLIAYWLFFNRKKSTDFSFQFELKWIKQILALSLPIMGVAIIPSLNVWLISSYTSYVMNAETVALFSAPNRLTVFMTLPLVALGYIYLPSVSKLNSPEQREDLKKFYQSVTKWTVLISLPMFIFIFFKADFIVTFLFGEEYLASGDVLKIIALGAVVSIFLGHNYLTIVALGGKSTLVMSSLFSLVCMGVVAYFSVPVHGHIGAALASATGIISLNLLISFRLFAKFKVHPFDAHTTLCLLAAILFCVFLMWICSLVSDGLISLLLFAPLAYLGMVMMPIITRTSTTEDANLYSSLEKKMPATFVSVFRKLFNANSR